MNVNQDLVNKTISFETYQGARFTNLKLMSFLDAQTAAAFDDVAAKHVQNYPFIPDPKPQSWTDYMYVKFLDADNRATFFGAPWIKGDSIVINDAPAVQISIPAGGATQAQLDAIASMMTAIGVSGFTFTTV